MMELKVSVMLLMTLIKMLKIFKNKLMVLMCIELLFLMSILTVMTKGEQFTIFFLLSSAVFMVLDSTMGISLMVANSRSSSPQTMKKMLEM